MSKNVRQLTVRSDRRELGTSSSFYFKLEKDVLVKKISLLNASIPATFYNVTQVTTLNTGLGNLVVNPGNYSIDDLVGAINVALKALDPNFDCVFDKVTMKVTITNTINFNLPFSSSVGGPQLASLLGYDLQDYTGSSGYAAQSVPNVYQSDFYILIPEVGMLGSGAVSNDRYTFIVPNEVLRGDYASFNSMSNFQQFDFADPRSIPMISVQLRWPDGNLVDLNGADWTFTLSLETL